MFCLNLKKCLSRIHHIISDVVNGSTVDLIPLLIEFLINKLIPPEYFRGFLCFLRVLLTTLKSLSLISSSGEQCVFVRANKSVCATVYFSSGSFNLHSL